MMKLTSKATWESRWKNKRGRNKRKGRIGKKSGEWEIENERWKHETREIWTVVKNEDIGIPGKEKEKRSWEVGRLARDTRERCCFSTISEKKYTVEILNVIARDKS